MNPFSGSLGLKTSWFYSCSGSSSWLWSQRSSLPSVLCLFFLLVPSLALFVSPSFSSLQCWPLFTVQRLSWFCSCKGLSQFSNVLSPSCGRRTFGFGEDFELSLSLTPLRYCSKSIGKQFSPLGSILSTSRSCTAGGPGRCPNTGQTQYYVVHELPSFLEFFLVVIFFSLASRSSTSGTSSSTTIHYIARLFSSPTSRVVALTMLATLHRIKIVVVLFL